MKEAISDYVYYCKSIFKPLYLKCTTIALIMVYFGLLCCLAFRIPLEGVDVELNKIIKVAVFIGISTYSLSALLFFVLLPIMAVIDEVFNNEV